MEGVIRSNDLGLHLPASLGIPRRLKEGGNPAVATRENNT